MRCQFCRAQIRCAECTRVLPDVWFREIEEDYEKVMPDGRVVTHRRVTDILDPPGPTRPLRQFSTEEKVRLLYHNKPDEADRILREFADANEAERYDKAVIIHSGYSDLSSQLMRLKYEQLVGVPFPDDKSAEHATVRALAYRAVLRYFESVIEGRHVMFESVWPG